MHLWIEETLASVEALQPNKFATQITYLLLNLAYKIDYLITSEGQLMDAVERIHKIYFLVNEASITEKNNRIIQEFRRILILPQAEVYKELYRIKATFGVSSPTSPLQVGNVIRDELNSLNTDRNTSNPAITIKIMEHAIQYCLFYYGMPAPTKKLLHFMVIMLNADYFKSLGFKQTFHDPTTNSLDKTAIKRKIKSIEEEGQIRFPHFKVNTSNLKYGNLSDFVHSLLSNMQGTQL